MASNLSDVGFVAQTGPEMEELARLCDKHGTRHKCPGGAGSYIVWPAGQGIELWAQLNGQDELIGLNPHFDGKSRTSLGLTQRVTRAGFALDGGFVALAQPYGLEPLQGLFSLVFDVPDFFMHAELALPLIQSVQLTAFVQQCALYENEDDFRARVSRRGGGNLHPDSVIPLGMLDATRQPLAEPLATAMVCGKVQDAATLKNSYSGREFYWIRLKTSAGEVDAVADVDLLPGVPGPNHVFQCSAWLSGKLMR